jgi:hypothetical protein
MPRLATAFPEFRSQRDEMGSGRGWHLDTCRYPVRATVATANCGAGGPRFGLVCQASTQRREEMATASYGRALRAIGNSLGKRKRRFDLLPAHGMCAPEMACTGSCMSALRPRFEGAWACGASKHGFFQACFDARICSPAAASCR